MMAAQTQTNAKTFVLVHGAWHGGWCWRPVADLLEKRGHKVFTPTLTGLGERSHLMSSGIDLATHVTDIVHLMKWERLTDVVLVGHSYAGFVISGVAERMPAAIGSMVFLDAMVPENGQSLVEITLQATRDAILGAARRGEISVPPRPAAFFHVNEADRAWVDAMCTPQPIATMLDKIALTGARERVPKKAYIRAQSYPNPAFDAAYSAVKLDPSWQAYEVPCGHDVMVDMPERLVEIMLEVSQA